MSESHTEGGGSYASLGRGGWAGQTFRPLVTHTLEWIDLNIRLFGISPRPTVLILYADVYHQPFGSVLSRNRWWELDYSVPFKTYRIRFPMQRLLLYDFLYYCILVWASPALGESCPMWEFQKGQASYPRGHRIYSFDSRATWQQHYLDDHIFVEFGTPPAPPPPPEPPVSNFAILDITYTHTETGVRLFVTTNVPVHLFMEYTVTEPEKHRKAIYERGIRLPDAIRYCFVTWHENEQEEAGDTLYHTFIKEPWPYCEVRWFTFKGKINGEWSPSVGPIFRYHRKAPDHWLIISEPWTVDIAPPVMAEILLEQWTTAFEPPELSEVILEEWTS